MEPASLTTWLQPLQLTTQSIQSVWKCQVLFRILQTFKNLNLFFVGQMIKSQSEKWLAQNESNISVGVHVGSSLIKVKDTHLMNNNQPVAEILCWRLAYRRLPQWCGTLLADVFAYCLQVGSHDRLFTVAATSAICESHICMFLLKIQKLK